MGKPLLSQLIKLEEMFEETRKSGTPVQEELKVAILLKCISGPLKTRLNLLLDGSAQYAEVRDQVLRWNRYSRSGLVCSFLQMTIEQMKQCLWNLSGLVKKAGRKAKARKENTRVTQRVTSTTTKEKGNQNPKEKMVESDFQKVTRAPRANMETPKVKENQIRAISSVLAVVRWDTMQKTVGRKFVQCRIPQNVQQLAWHRMCQTWNFMMHKAEVAL